MWDQICQGRYQDLFWHNNGLYSLKVASIPSTVLEPDWPLAKVPKENNSQPLTGGTIGWSVVTARRQIRKGAQFIYSA